MITAFQRSLVVLAVSALIGATAHAAGSTTSPAAAPVAAPTARQLAALCDSCAIVQSTKTERRKGKATALGTAGGAVVGGVVGNKVGDGGGVATGVGAVAGAVIGREIEKQAKKQKVWVTKVTTKDGKTQKFEAKSDPAFDIGEVVRIEDGKLVKMTMASK